MNLLKDGFHLTGDSNALYVVQYKDKKELLFNVKINMDTSFLLGAYLCRINADPKVRVVLQKATEQPDMSINTAHKLLGHHGEVGTRQIAKALRISLTKGNMEVCKACAIAKARQ